MIKRHSDENQNTRIRSIRRFIKEIGDGDIYRYIHKNVPIYRFRDDRAGQREQKWGDAISTLFSVESYQIYINI